MVACVAPVTKAFSLSLLVPWTFLTSSIPILFSQVLFPQNSFLKPFTVFCISSEFVNNLWAVFQARCWSKCVCHCPQNLHDNGRFWQCFAARNHKNKTRILLWSIVACCVCIYMRSLNSMITSPLSYSCIQGICKKTNVYSLSSLQLTCCQFLPNVPLATIPPSFQMFSCGNSFWNLLLFLWNFFLFFCFILIFFCNYFSSSVSLSLVHFTFSIFCFDFCNNAKKIRNNVLF